MASSCSGFSCARRSASALGNPLTFKECFAFADDTQSQMRKRRKIATGADRALFRNDRMDAPIQHVANQLDHFAREFR